MKDAKFIELLNLYVDHQIGAEDAALLEAEIHRDPERRRVYRQYCQMQKACVMLADSFRTETPVGGKIVEFAPPRRRLQAVAYAMGALAAAACVALVVVQRHSARSNNAAASIVQNTTRSATEAESAPMPAPARVALQPVFAGVLNDESAPTLAAAANDRAPFEWMTRVQLQRMPAAENLWFESRPALQPQDLSFPARPSTEVQAAFRFQK